LGQWVPGLLHLALLADLLVALLLRLLLLGVLLLLGMVSILVATTLLRFI